MYNINVGTTEELQELISSDGLNISKTIINVIKENLTTTKRFINVMEIYVEEDDIILDITLDREQFLSTLEINLKTLEKYEAYEECYEAKKLIDKIKKLN